ncbi:methyltransferase [Nocardiopsis ansamitocini]|uniref:Methyltransferase/methylase n=1 Tax=Nocardiopsis ansamitocini TaxID=1670832 RepID=A0A9W6UL40_9ACTN|nr:methyltransferase [Nocardiopsis ansamitocini]GLU50342.1 methyltransferase/methylase [Nocardiopsis ansamitocini]
MTAPDTITELLWDQWKTKTLHSAIQLRVFTELGRSPLTSPEIRARLGLRAGPRAVEDFMDSLVALGLLLREEGRYRNGPEAAHYLDAGRPEVYLGAAIDQALDGPVIDVAADLRAGHSPDALPSAQEFYSGLYTSEEGSRGFLRIMTAESTGPAQAMAERFPWERYRRLVDVGCAEGAVAAQIVDRHPHLSAIGFDLPPVRPAFEEFTTAAGVTDRVRFQAGDFFAEALPEADVVVFGQVLHNWDLERKRILIGKAYEALPPGGAVVVYERLVDEDRRSSLGALFMSLRMNLALGGGFDFTGAECEGWLRDAGFARTSVRALDANRSMVIGFKEHAV